MSFGFAGALAGLGEGLMKVGDDRRKQAMDLLKMEKQAELEVDVAKAKSKLKGSGGGSGSGSGRGGARNSSWRLSNTDEVRLKETYTSLFGAPGEGDSSVPTLLNFKSKVEEIMRSDKSISRMDAEQQAASLWTGREVTETTQEPRGFFGRTFEKMTGAGGGDGMREETTSRMEYGFDSALGGSAAPATSAPAQGSTQEAPASARANIPPAAIQALKADPSLREQFDEKYGKGAAASILGT